MSLFTRSSSAQSVCIVGVGACTSVGYSAASAAAAVRAGVTTFGEHPYMIDRAGEKMIVARVDALPPDLEVPQRLEELGIAAAEEALAPVQDHPFLSVPRMPAALGLPYPRVPQDSEAASPSASLLRTLRSRPEITQIALYPNGHAAGLMALQAGMAAIQHGESEFFLVGGADSYLNADTLEWLDDTEQLHSEANTWGFVPGEAAGFCLLASERAAQRYSLQPLLSLLSAATDKEPNLIRTDTVCLGEGLSRAVKKVLQALPEASVVHQTFCDMNGERYRSDELAFTICRTSRHFVDASLVQTPADCWGDVGAASGPLFIALAAAAQSKHYAQGPNTLLWASSDTGERSAALLTAAGSA